MPLKLTLGLARKVGLPRYGSLGANCSVEMELSGTLLEREPEAFQEQVRQAYLACDRAIREELLRQQTLELPRRMNHDSPLSSGEEGLCENPADDPDTSRASNRQLDFARRLATQVAGLGVRRLEELAERRFGHPLDELSLPEASALIDLLKQVRAGKHDLTSVLADPAA